MSVDRGAGVCGSECRRLWIGVQTSVDRGAGVCGSGCRRLWIGVQTSVDRGADVCGSGCRRLWIGVQTSVDQSADVCGSGCRRLWIGVQTRDVSTKFCWGDGFIGTQTHLPPKFSFSSDFGHFILKMMENAKIVHMGQKKAEISSFLGGTSPQIVRLRGARLPVPPPRFRRPWCRRLCIGVQTSVDHGADPYGPGCRSL